MAPKRTAAAIGHEAGPIAGNIVAFVMRSSHIVHGHGLAVFGCANKTFKAVLDDAAALVTSQCPVRQPLALQAVYLMVAEQDTSQGSQLQDVLIMPKQYESLPCGVLRDTYYEGCSRCDVRLVFGGMASSSIGLEAPVKAMLAAGPGKATAAVGRGKAAATAKPAAATAKATAAAAAAAPKAAPPKAPLTPSKAAEPAKAATAAPAKAAAPPKSAFTDHAKAAAPAEKAAAAAAVPAKAASVTVMVQGDANDAPQQKGKQPPKQQLKQPKQQPGAVAGGAEGNQAAEATAAAPPAGEVVGAERSRAAHQQAPQQQVNGDADAEAHADADAWEDGGAGEEADNGGAAPGTLPVGKSKRKRIRRTDGKLPGQPDGLPAQMESAAVPSSHDAAKVARQQALAELQSKRQAHQLLEVSHQAPTSKQPAKKQKQGEQQTEQPAPKHAGGQEQPAPKQTQGKERPAKQQPTAKQQKEQQAGSGANLQPVNPICLATGQVEVLCGSKPGLMTLSEATATAPGTARGQRQEPGLTISCRCSECVGKPPVAYTGGTWERHAGLGQSKKWRSTIRIVNGLQGESKPMPFGDWIDLYNSARSALA